MTPTPAAVEAALSKVAQKMSKQGYDITGVHSKFARLIIEELKAHQPPTDALQWSKVVIDNIKLRANKLYIAGDPTLVYERVDQAPALPVEPDDFLIQALMRTKSFIQKANDGTATGATFALVDINNSIDLARLYAQSPARVNREIFDAFIDAIRVINIYYNGDGYACEWLIKHRAAIKAAEQLERSKP